MVNKVKPMCLFSYFAQLGLAEINRVEVQLNSGHTRVIRKMLQPGASPTISILTIAEVSFMFLESFYITGVTQDHHLHLSKYFYSKDHRFESVVGRWYTW